MLVLRDIMIESFGNPTSPTWEDIIEHRDIIVDNHDNHIVSSPNILHSNEDDNFVLEDIIESHENIVSPFPNAPSPSLDASPICDEATLKNMTMECDEHLVCYSPKIYPTMVDI